MKTVNEVLSAAKGEGHENEIVTGKGSFSKSGFGDLVSSLANDTTYRITTYDKDGKETGDLSISELIRGDIKKTLAEAKYPQQSEAAVLDTCNICTSGLAQAIPQIVMEQISCGKKFDLPTKPDVNGSIYLADVPAGTKTSAIRDIKTQEPLGSVTTTNEAYIAVKAKSPAPESKVTRTRTDVNGNPVK